MVNPEIWSKVPDGDVGESVGLTQLVEDGKDNHKSNVADDDPFCVLGFIQGAGGVEVVDTVTEAVLLSLSSALTLAFVEVMSSNVHEQVHGPTSQLLANGMEQGGKRSLLGQLVDFVDGFANTAGVFSSGLWHKDHVALHVASGFVVLAVRDLPGEVRDEQGGVADQTDSVVEDLGGGERLMTALVSQNPQAGAEKTLNKGIDEPQGGAGWGERHILWCDELVEEGKGDAYAGNITEHVEEAPCARALEAVLRDRIAEVVDGVVGDLELVAVGVDELAPLLLLGELNLGGQRGEGSGGRRLARRVDGGGNGSRRRRVSGAGGHGSAKKLALGKSGGNRSHVCRWYAKRTDMGEIIEKVGGS